MLSVAAVGHVMGACKDAHVNAFRFGCVSMLALPSVWRSPLSCFLFSVLIDVAQCVWMSFV